MTVLEVHGLQLLSVLDFKSDRKREFRECMIQSPAVSDRGVW